MLLSLPGAAVLASETTSYTSTSIPAAADTSIAELRMQLKALQARLDALEQQAEPTRNTVQALVASADTKANFKGDLRYRHEAFSIDAKPTRQRHRIRARVSTTKAIEENQRFLLHSDWQQRSGFHQPDPGRRKLVKKFGA